jgi:hypothetical protein
VPLPGSGFSGSSWRASLSLQTPCVLPDLDPRPHEPDTASKSKSNARPARKRPAV